MLTDYMRIERLGNGTLDGVAGTVFKVYEFDGRRHAWVLSGTSVAPGNNRTDEECAKHWAGTRRKLA
ncbi:MAG TPA: hypothetical protein VF292_09345 [Rhodanobacteraceae bacterium]